MVVSDFMTPFPRIVTVTSVLPSWSSLLTILSMLLYPPPSCWLSGPLSSAPMLLYSGGMPRASYGDRHCLTVQQDKEHVTLDFTSRVIDFFTIHSVEREQG